MSATSKEDYVEHEIFPPPVPPDRGGNTHRGACCLAARLPGWRCDEKPTNASIQYADELVRNPVNLQAWTPKVKLGGVSSGAVHKDFPLMGIIGRPSVVHFAGVTQWTYSGKQMNGIRLVQIHPAAAQRAGIKNSERIVVESLHGSITGTALLWEGIREDTIFVPNTFGPAQKMAEEIGTPIYEPANMLVSDRYFDNLSGQQAYKCFACKIWKP